MDGKGKALVLLPAAEQQGLVVAGDHAFGGLRVVGGHGVRTQLAFKKRTDGACRCAIHGLGATANGLPGLGAGAFGKAATALLKGRPSCTVVIFLPTGEVFPSRRSEAAGECRGLWLFSGRTRRAGSAGGAAGRCGGRRRCRAFRGGENGWEVLAGTQQQSNGECAGQ